MDVKNSETSESEQKPVETVRARDADGTALSFDHLANRPLKLPTNLQEADVIEVISPERKDGKAYYIFMTYSSEKDPSDEKKERRIAIVRSLVPKEVERLKRRPDFEIAHQVELPKTK